MFPFKLGSSQPPVPVHRFRFPPVPLSILIRSSKRKLLGVKRAARPLHRRFRMTIFSWPITNGDHRMTKGKNVDTRGICNSLPQWFSKKCCSQWVDLHKGKSKPETSQILPWNPRDFPVFFPLNQSIDVPWRESHYGNYQREIQESIL